MSVGGWEVVIGLEVHAQLATGAKLFAPEPYVFGAEPNTLVSVVTSAQPGALPVLDRRAIRLALRVALALDCDVADVSSFDRKHYFYCDLPKGYQITQLFRPYCSGGAVTLADGRKVPLVRIHVEEDAGKATHDRGDDTLVDLNRAGVPLIELVTEPALRSADDAVAFLEAYREVLVYTGASDADMEKGNLRCDVNVSVRRPGEPLRTKVELKNLNSLRNVHAAILHEVARQSSAYERGAEHEVVQETRLYDPDRDETRTMRSKEDAHDYRYMPDPDLPPVVVTSEELAAVRAAMPELAPQRRERYVSRLGLSEYDAGVLTGSRETSDFFDEVVRLAGDGAAKSAANWVSNQVLGALSNAEITASTLSDLPFGPHELAELLRLVDEGTLHQRGARDVFERLVREGGSPREWVEKLDLGAVRDDGAIEEWCRAAIAANAKAADAVRSGNEKAVGALVGAVMKASAGKADPAGVREALLRLLAES
ncbi:MAG: Asp-tRNA(Asn)/Glu-tRNA(Gln) amidotransferase subunit GatB [Planctomycetota bacterium]